MTANVGCKLWSIRMEIKAFESAVCTDSNKNFSVSNIHIWTENMGSTVLYGPKHPCLD